VLAKSARLTDNSDFARATKSGLRATTDHFVGYLYTPTSTNQAPAKSGLIINKSIGGSVARHRLARKVRHALAPLVINLPTGSLLVIRALKQEGDKNITSEISQLVEKLILKSKKTVDHK
jgi:ribonuclease P protein component